MWDFSSMSIRDHKRRRGVIRMMGDIILVSSGLGWVTPWVVFVQAHVSRFARLFN